ncbi:hypothetical protein CB1_015275001 [Camelus ferus]|nr:hypothetical protein CB1_015275001 [Camelus ferus]
MISDEDLTRLSPAVRVVVCSPFRALVVTSDASPGRVNPGLASCAWGVESRSPDPQTGFAFTASLLLPTWGHHGPFKGKGYDYPFLYPPESLNLVLALKVFSLQSVQDSL